MISSGVGLLAGFAARLRFGWLVIEYFNHIERKVLSNLSVESIFIINYSVYDALVPRFFLMIVSDFSCVVKSFVCVIALSWFYINNYVLHDNFSFLIFQH